MCILKTEVDKSVIDAKDELLHDLSSAHVRGLVNDVTFICNDGVKLSSNKSLLSVRSPFFNSMMFGGFKNTVEEEVEFKSCDSEVLKHVLNYVWRGTIDLKSLSFEVLLNLLETSRMLCLDTLVKGIEDYLIYNTNLSQFNHDELLELLDFAILNKFDFVQQCTLLNIDKILGMVSECSRFEMLSDQSILSILTYPLRTSSEAVLFEAFLVWIKPQDNIVESTKHRMLNVFDLKKFDEAYLLSKVRKTGYFEEQVIFDVLEEKVAEVEKTLKNTVKDIKEKNLRVTSLETELSKMEKWNNVNVNKFKILNIVKFHSHLLSWSVARQVFKTHYGTFIPKGLSYVFDNIEFINNIRFDVRTDPQSKFSYAIESSVDGLKWLTLAEFSNCRGEQNIYFPMQDMKYLCFHSNNVQFVVKEDSVVLLLDTKSGERKNKTS